MEQIQKIKAQNQKLKKENWALKETLEILSDSEFMDDIRQAEKEIKEGKLLEIKCI